MRRVDAARHVERQHRQAARGDRRDGGGDRVARRRPRSPCRAARRRRGRRRRGLRQRPVERRRRPPAPAPRPTPRRRRTAGTRRPRRAAPRRAAQEARDHAGRRRRCCRRRRRPRRGGRPGSARRSTRSAAAPAPAIRSTPGTPWRLDRGAIGRPHRRGVVQRRPGNGHGGRVSRPSDPYHPPRGRPPVRHRPGDDGDALPAGRRGRARWSPSATRPTASRHPAPGLVEHDAEEIWARTPGGGRRRAGRDAGGRRACAPSASPTSARPSSSGSARRAARIAPAIVWQDTRTEDACRALEDGRARGAPARADGPGRGAVLLGHEARLAARPRRRRAPHARGGRRAGGGHDRRLAADAPHRPPRHRRDERLAHAARRPRHAGVGRASCASCCACRRRCCRRSRRRGRRTPTARCATARWPASRHRACSATSRRRCSGRRAASAGDAKCTYGTGSFLLAITGERPRALGARACSRLRPASPPTGRRPTAWRAPSRSRAARSAGSSTSSACSRAPRESADVAASVPDTGGVQVVPAFQGLYAPWWDGTARGTIVRASRCTPRGRTSCGRRWSRSPT